MLPSDPSEQDSTTSSSQASTESKETTASFDWPDPPSLEQLASMSDAAIAKAFGMDEQIKKAKEAIVAAASLSGEAKKIAEERVQRMFNPPSYALNDLTYLVEDAKRQAKRSAREEIAHSPEPADIL